MFAYSKREVIPQQIQPAENSEGADAFISQVRRDLESSNPETRRMAVQSLARSTYPRAREVLEDATRHHMPDVKIEASFQLAHLANFEDGRAVPGLIEGLKDKESRLSAIQFLGLIGDRRAVDPLLQVLGGIGSGKAAHTFYKLEERERAAFALGRIGDPRAIDGLMNALRMDNAKVGLTAVNALKDINNVSIVPKLAAFLLNEAEYHRILSSGGDTPQYPGLVNQLYHAVIRTLEHLDTSQNWELVGLRSVHPDLRQKMAEALGQSGDVSAVKALSEKLLDEDEKLNVREACAKALGQIGDPSAVQVLLQVLNAPTNEAFTETVIRSLGKIGSDEAVSKLLSMSANKSRFTNDASDAIRSMGDAAIPKLLELLDSADTSSKQKEEIINHLRQVTNFDETVVLALLQALRDPNQSVGREAEHCLIERADRQHLELFLENVSSDDAWTRWVCIHCLGKIGGNKAVLRLITLLNDPERRVVNKVRETLDNIGTPEAREALRKWRESHPNE